jgi:hypothetical protein
MASTRTMPASRARRTAEQKRFGVSSPQIYDFVVAGIAAVRQHNPAPSIYKQERAQSPKRASSMFWLKRPWRIAPSALASGSRAGLPAAGRPC